MLAFYSFVGSTSEQQSHRDLRTLSAKSIDGNFPLILLLCDPSSEIGVFLRARSRLNRIKARGQLLDIWMPLDESALSETLFKEINELARSTSIQVPFPGIVIINSERSAGISFGLSDLDYPALDNLIFTVLETAEKSTDPVKALQLLKLKKSTVRVFRSPEVKNIASWLGKKLISSE